ncbi:uncharacterized protein MELLADRAFT_54399 [Melampsora larici-populina 98AG31]|uniref:Uncharacterized protein n=1 Tax=Melampsora larici-populina (strain 98AG31 / pathotype 3-4-7) TaxID=747676 RepID=F4R3A6_MELLP|nr:uncharacterized protein MELLADRAFT_54399 [Melampsora larici-populina 98AG31]EGG12596.1 hypothetical protein MELLADRAFT_54399 [Melampsora larici-populina 98AG31]
MGELRVYLSLISGIGDKKLFDEGLLIHFDEVLLIHFDEVLLIHFDEVLSYSSSSIM